MRINQTSSELIAQKKFPEAGTRKRVIWEYERIQKAIEGINGLVEVSESQAADSYTEDFVNGNLEVRQGLKSIINMLENRLFELQLFMPRIPEQQIKRKTFFARFKNHFKR